MEEQLTDVFPEFREISVIDPLRQGDVLEAVASTASHWQRHLLVLTADCDLAFAKHRGRVTCAPLLTAQEYLLETKIPDLREKALVKFVGELRKVLPDKNSNISDERIKAWPSEVAPDEIIVLLGLTGQHADVAEKVLKSIRLISHEAESLDDAVEALIESQASAPNAKSRDKIVDAVVQALKAPLSQPPGDALFLSSIAPNNNLGYFAYLRHVEQVQESEIATSPGRKTVRYRRIARLQDRYIHALVQQFALVFMSIGLPSEYEDMRRLHSEYLGETYQ
ncbi:hypothetical protein [Nocardia arizonensis]|uniref:hypothetical protein n=1 Tax=Nocardia arizonensis TaxID=1141647 RepID=UPI0007A756EE|nr:hypothetical protein [Nocardia arizonensis]